MTGDPHAAEDLTQETFLRAHRSLSSFRGESRPETWLLAIAKNLGASHMGRVSRGTLSGLDRLIAEASDPRGADDLTGWERKVCTAQVTEGCLLGLLRCLPKQQRAAFILCGLEGLSAGEAAPLIGKSPNAVRILLHRGRSAVRNFLCTHCSLYDPDNSCRCINLARFSLGKGWIDRTGKGLDPETVSDTLLAAGDEIALYRSLPRRILPEKVK